MFLKKTLDIEHYLHEAPLTQERRVVDDDHASFGWRGHIIGREWPAAMAQSEINLLRVGGKKSRLASPDYSSGLCPVYVLTDAETREAQRLMDSYCLGGVETHNIVCNQGRTNLLNFLTFATTGVNSGYTGVVAFGVGTTTGTVSASDTQLFGGAETFRKQIGLTTISGNSVDFTIDFAANEANYTYADCGIFGSTPTNVASTTTVNTGILYAHALYAYTKNNNVILANDYYIYFS
jgi:hypothetical protein